MNSVATLSGSRITLPTVFVRAQQIKMQGATGGWREKNQIWPRQQQFSDHRCDSLMQFAKHIIAFCTVLPPD
jgi:hypothetical protein